jgi:MORN repeat
VNSSEADPMIKKSIPRKWALLNGTLDKGKAHGSGVYVGGKRVRYEGQFVNGKLEAMNC